jgi:hypothetical protein
MANEKRLRALAIGGLVEDNPLTAAATSLASAGLAALAAVGASEHAALVLDPDGMFGAPEVVYVTSHTAAATSATILRGQEGTTARQHDRDVPWIHGPSVKDFVTPLTRQGGSATDWSASGTTTQPLPTRMAEQVGALPYSGLASGGTVTLTFPFAFAYPPIMSAVCGPTFAADTNVVPAVTVLSATGATFIVWSRTGLSGLGGTIHWRALGEIA